MTSKRWKLDKDRPVVLYGIDLHLSEAALAALRADGVEPAACADGRPALAGSVWRERLTPRGPFTYFRRRGIGKQQHIQAGEAA